VAVSSRVCGAPAWPVVIEGNGELAASGLGRNVFAIRQNPAHNPRARRMPDEVSDRWKERKPCERRRAASPFSLNASNHAERQANATS
jgi:hypothetical protein